MARAGVEAEQLEEGVIAIGQPARAVAAEDGIALRVHQPLVAGLALVQARIDDGGILERGLQPAGDDLQLGGLAGQGQSRSRVASRWLSRQPRVTARAQPNPKGLRKFSRPQISKSPTAAASTTAGGAAKDDQKNTDDPCRHEKDAQSLRFSAPLCRLRTFRNRLKTGARD